MFKILLGKHRKISTKKDYKWTVLWRRNKKGLNLRLILSEILLLHPGHLLGFESSVINTSSPQLGQKTEGRPSG
ncbi:hypothetical protein BU679_02625 [Staphylococcus chromogenes]|uniref:hypothetical protein n=1 Tax=Staphylococcus chromogenes TaxID=46126 RepID=UPI000D1BB830|nr:hypothetical protein [Staphylococcus chromogenes]MCE4966395.1 hypothetical protein [Staphylococcus chromogenes]PTF76274.1 hypothetical protein BUX97_03805 [Staphylococcus chromogenes]PTG52648.1 hypothetical protein BU679_02625 [Staphylococcus chromogenes]RIM07934.1 hypothetical protein BU680_05345 [Staphylococcus chromogenes]